MLAGKYRQNLYKLGSGIFQRLLTHKQERTRTDHLHTFLNCSRDNVRERLLVHILRRKLYPIASPKKTIADNKKLEKRNLGKDKAKEMKNNPMKNNNAAA